MSLLLSGNASSSEQPAGSPSPGSTGTSGRPGDGCRPKSFLREEVDEFEKLFSELLLSPPKKLAECLYGDSSGEDSPVDELKIIEEDDESAELSNCEDCDNMDRLFKKRVLKKGAKSCDQPCDHCDVVCGKSPVTPKNDCKCRSVPPKYTRSASDHSCAYQKTSASENGACFSPQGAVRGIQSPGESGLTGTPGDSPLNITDENDRLFTQLLDDLDNITGNTPSVRRRRKARDLFSSWLFSDDARSPPDLPIQRCREAFRDYAKRRSADLQNFDVRKQEYFKQWRPKSFEYLSEVSI